MNKTILSIQSSLAAKNLLRLLSLLLVGALFYLMIVVIPVPAKVTDYFQDITLISSCFVIAGLALVFGRRGWTWELVKVSLVILLFILPVISRWQTGYYHANIFGGILPWSDASDYYIDAQQLLLGNPFTQTSTKRPLFTGLLSVLLFITHQNLQISVLILSFIVALACYLLIREINVTHGALAGAFCIVIIYIFYRRYAGQTMTESLGLCLGALALAVIWRGARKRQASLVLSGLFVLAMALVARAGAFFILPALLIWGGIYFREQKRFNLSFALKGILAVLAAFAINAGLSSLLGKPNDSSFSNYSLTFYGLVVGNKGWAQFLTDYPGVPESQVWKMAFQKIKENPGTFASGIIQSYADYFSTFSGAYSFSYFRGWGLRVFKIILWLLSIFGLVSIYFRRSRLRDTFFLFGFLGVFLSVSLVPPIDADNMRAYAATIPFTAFLAANGLAIPFFQKKQVEESPADSHPSDMRSPIILFSFGLIALSVLGPLILLATGAPRNLSKPLSCPEGLADVEIAILPGSYFLVVPDEFIAQSYLPYIRESDFRRTILESEQYWPELARELLAVGSTHLIVAGINRADYYHEKPFGTNVFLVTSSIAPPNGLLKTCATPAKSEWLNNRGFRYADGPPAELPKPSSLYHQAKSLSLQVGWFYGLIVLAVLVTAWIDWVHPIRNLFLKDERK